MSTRWGNSGTVAETDAEWIKRGGHLNTHWPSDTKDCMEWNAPSVQSSPERTFLLTILEAALQDATGQGTKWNKPCGYCAYEPHTPRHTVQACARTWLQGQHASDICDALAVNRDYILRLLKTKGTSATSETSKANQARRHSRLSSKARRAP